MTVWSGGMASPVGPLTIGVADGRVRFVVFGIVDLARRIHGGDVVTLDHGVADPGETDRGVLADVERQLVEYFRAEREVFDLPLDPVGTTFQLAAWSLLRTIPYGTTTTYGEQARKLGDVRRSRAVGAANGANPIAVIVPCHRVIGHNGDLVGFGGGLAAKRWLLDHEQRRIRPTFDGLC